MIGKGSILYDVTAGVTIAPVSAIGRLDLERTEIETTTHGPRERRTHRVGLKRTPRSLSAELPGERRTGGPIARPLRIGRVRGICSDLPGPLDIRVRGVCLRSRAGDARDGLIHRSFRFLPTGVTEPRLSAIAFCGTYYDYSQWSAPGDDYPAAPAGACPVQFDISKWYT